MSNIGNIALRDLAELAEPGSLVDGPVEITLREQDFQVISVKDPGTGQERAAPTVAKIHFTVARFREVMVDSERSGIWEFTIAGRETPDGPVPPSRVWVDGADILLVKKQNKVL